MTSARVLARVFGSPRSLVPVVALLTPVLAGAQRQAIRPPERVGPPPGPARLVLVARSSGSEGAVVPPEGLSIAVGCGPALDPASSELLRVRLGPEGRLELPFPWAELRARGVDGSEMWARVVDGGWQRSTRGFRAAANPGTQEVTLLPRRGWSICGRLLDRAGEPCEGLVRALRRGAEGVLEEVGGVGVDGRAQGRFELGLDTPEPVHLVARMARLSDDLQDGLQALLLNAWPAEELAGTVVRLDVDPRGSGAVELRARGPGVLRARLLDPSGTPRVGIDLLARSSELALDPSRARREELALRGAGAIEAIACTDGDGAFELTGLREGSFVLFAGHSPPWLQRGERVSDAAIPADGVRRDLVARVAPVLRVRVVDPDGGPWPAPVRGEPGPQRCFDPWFLDGSPDGPVQVLVAVDPSSRGGGHRPGETIAPVPGSEVEGRVAFEVEPGLRYLVRARSADGRWGLTSVAIPAEVVCVEHVTTIPDAEFGTLAVLPLNAVGEIVTDEEIRVEDLASGYPLVRLEPSHGLGSERPRSLRLPVGSYRLVVQGRRAGSREPRSVPERRHGAYETIVAIEPDRETRVVGRLGVGARLRVHLVGAASERDRLAAADLLAPSRDEASRARLELLAAGRWPAPVLFEIEDDPGRVRTGLDLGATGLSELQPAGRCTLTARLPGGRVAEAPVELLDGVTTEVELVFDAP